MKKVFKSKYMTSQELVTILEISPAFFSKLVKANQIPGAVKIGSTYRISRKDFKKWLALGGNK